MRKDLITCPKAYRQVHKICSILICYLFVNPSPHYTETLYMMVTYDLSDI